MKLERLFEIQKTLDEKIVENKGLQGENLLDKKVLALQVELGECANEYRVFKFWSNDQEPRTAWKQPSYRGGYIERNLVLEEYVDCLHFILSIGLELSISGNVVRNERFNKNRNVIQQFTSMFVAISDLLGNIWLDRPAGIVDQYHDMVTQFILLGEKLGFTGEQIEQAYLDKNKVNHERQANGY
ncbi:hypothetical protein BEH_11655 [Priestia filamentosa]|uniref:dUTPase n=1 Tax=Priestia filamentosa TaxID=1402861 RepID=A0A0H4KIS0_9BACI|nr:dUTP diphosphatase [Priestia filamentosa]AKO92691.1 hypothetical protein BEH_11655 [Priestia filamentosa]